MKKLMIISLAVLSSQAVLAWDSDKGSTDVCTDQNGIQYGIGDAGYNDCMKLKKPEVKKQMPGQAAKSDPTDIGSAKVQGGTDSPLSPVYEGKG